jgi:O-antigen/teichoic acid export membrane protein
MRFPRHHKLGTWPSLLRSFGWLAAGEAFARVFGAVAVIVMARRLGPVIFGVVILGVTLTNWFRLVVDGGTEVVSMRDIARRPERFRSIAGAILGLRLVLSLGAVALFIAAAATLAPAQTGRMTLVLFALVMPMIALNLRWMVLGVQSSHAVALGNIASQVLLAVGVVLLVRDRHDGALIALLYATAELAYALIVLVVVGRRFGLPLPRIEVRRWWGTLREGFPVMAMNVARTVMYSADLLLIAIMLDRTHVGLYAAAFRPILFGMGIVGLFGASFLASFSAARHGDGRDLFLRSTKVAAIVTTAAATLLSAGAGVFVSVVFGDGYHGAVVPMAILAWAIPLIALGAPYDSALIAAGRQSVLMRNNVIAAALNLATNLIAIPMFGVLGAAVTTLLAFATVLVLNYRSAVGLGLAPPASMILTGRPGRPAPEAPALK